MEKIMDPYLIGNYIINYATSSKITIEYCYQINCGYIDEILNFGARLHFILLKPPSNTFCL